MAPVPLSLLTPPLFPQFPVYTSPPCSMTFFLGVYCWNRLNLVPEDIFSKDGQPECVSFHLRMAIIYYSRYNFVRMRLNVCEVFVEGLACVACRGQLTLRACMTTSWASSSPSKILRRVSSSALLRASTFIFSSLTKTERDRKRLRERKRERERHKYDTTFLKPGVIL